MKFSCVLLNYNDAATTIGAIEKAKAMESIDYVVVVDNCSPNGDYEKLSQYADDKVLVYKTTHNGGYGFGNNYGMLRSEELGITHVVIANPDVSFNEKCIEELQRIFRLNPNCAVCAPCTYYRGKPCFSKLPTAKEILMESSSIHNRLWGRTTEYVTDHSKKEVICDEVVGAMLAIDITKLKPPIYDENMFLYCEEWVLGIKAKEAGYVTMVTLNATYTHTLSHSIDSSYDGLYKKRKLSNCSKLYYISHYLNIGGIRYNMYKIMFGLILVEARILDVLNKCLGK